MLRERAIERSSVEDDEVIEVRELSWVASSGTLHAPMAQYTLETEARQYTGYRRPRRRKQRPFSASTVACAVLASSIPNAMAQSCISLAGSTACSAFNASSISTDSYLTGLFPFLSDVTDTASFDSEIQNYIASGFTQQRYGTSECAKVSHTLTDKQIPAAHWLLKR